VDIKKDVYTHEDDDYHGKNMTNKCCLHENGKEKEKVEAWWVPHPENGSIRRDNINVLTMFIVRRSCMKKRKCIGSNP
jgi:hypothetical protein